MSGASWALRTTLTLEEVNAHLPALEDAGLLGIDESDGRATLWFPARPDTLLPVDGVWEEVADRDWNAAWRESLTPVVVGDVAVVPPWWGRAVAATERAETGRPGGSASREPSIVLRIEPAQAFGTGHHETTARCLDALQRAPLAGARVLDVGTGTGVLAIAALRLGAAEAVAVDTDPIAVATAEDNAEANLDEPARLEIRAGSVEAAPPPAYDVVVANLDTPTLRSVAGALVTALAPGGTLIASGVSLARTDEALDALAAAGIDAHAEPGAEWTLLWGTPATPGG